MNKNRSIDYNFNKELSEEIQEMSLEKIRDCIHILREHEILCEKENRYVEAGMAKDRLKEFKLLEEQKIFYDIQEKQCDQQNQLDVEQREELMRLNESYDKQFMEMTADFEADDGKLQERQIIEMEQGIHLFNTTFHVIPKPSTELMNLKKTLEGLGKQ